MIKANVISGHLDWKKNIKNPNIYLNKRLKILSEAPSFKRKNHEFSLLLTNNKKMKNLNFKFRKKNKTTDVLSFPIKIKNKSSLYLGDIAISFEFVSKRSIKTDFKYELDRMWVHGYLHLLGYNHIVYKDYKKMHLNELKILKYFEHKLYT